MDREELAGLLVGVDAASMGCRRAVSAGARYWVEHQTDRPVPASHLARIYAGRQRRVRKAGRPTTGFAEAVAVLRAQGERPIRLGAVDVAEPPYHYMLFLDEHLTKVLAVIGVRRRPEP
ncbi:hypothetical protein NCC78_28135 [Micromonospora phytophila]|uniref:hypothetical protein n=1 Tax=Micromonospora phytophila TaxID=709888 RepID=UPI00202EEC78|nr:hypothetical protein [Micromonospora phytophila]MCM0678514.1 hypothetical protein [Micromonospora phytophila]